MNKMHSKKLRCPGKAKKLNSRKAQAETQLNWIFILIVGAVILAFFTFIVIKQKGASESKFAGKVSTQLNTILVGAKVSSGTVQEIPTPELSIRFTCNDYYIGPASQRLGNKVLFAPEYLEGNKLITWTLDWNVPFKVTSFLYMTTPFVRYVIVGDSPRAEDIFNALPEKLNKIQLTPAEYDSMLDEGDRFVRFVFVDSTPPDNAIPADLSDRDVSGLLVDTSTKQLTFLTQSVADPNTFLSGTVFTYLEPEVLYGAIFSDNADEYECLMERAYARLNIVAKIYFEKFNEIAPIYDRTNCDGFYRKNVDLESLISATESYEPSYGNIGTIKDKLEETNVRLQLNSCPLIY
jgi:hypothetical protein